MLTLPQSLAEIKEQKTAPHCMGRYFVELLNYLFRVLISLMQTENITFGIQEIALPGNSGNDIFGHTNDTAGRGNLFGYFIKIFYQYRTNIGVGAVFLWRPSSRTRQ